MAQRSRPEPAQSGTFHLEHRYMEGLRFDGVWSYLARNSAGAWRWKVLPLPEAPSAWVRLGDPQGAWWCARQCAAVMNPSALPPQSRVKARVPHPRAPKPAALVQALQALLPDCSVQMHGCSDTANQAMDIAVNMAADMAQVLQAGGCALLRLASLDRKVERNGSAASVRWAWMVGTEEWHQVYTDKPTQESTSSTGAESTAHALLVVSPHWPSSWGGGFGAKVQPQADGSWRLASADGEVMHCRVTACIAVTPTAPAAGD